MTTKDALGDRMKMYEKAYSTKCMPLLPICVRIDGKNFSNWTKGLHRPYDKELSKLMVDVTKYLVQETQACIGYTQSDEISLIYYSDNSKSQLFFDGKLQKMCSVLSSMATMKFNQLLIEKTILFDRFKNKASVLFDCRVWQVPTLIEATNVLMWRELDATKNSVSMAASHYYSYKQLLRKNSSEKMDMLMQVGINWNNYPDFFKRGTYVQRKEVTRMLTVAELATLPEKHAARKNPDLAITRYVVDSVDMPVFSKIRNRVNVVFNGAEPILVE